ncbi:helix-turn-helix domain-containing protein [Sporolactobacillus spathodeae]|uniref:Zn-dependent peptidase ImmA (M78 family)/DNA-binding XRE family transcriptional regulator n=1 Tax=Sporolactobacillus spathodeae TaxID=1465502 RepID=A0ABS2QAD8_9BACL|nr:XRE family transcriptional regulator [Sporolactobacillus spathodeae]MBM7658410.1 Zn-dependent peptidase ImmA (M78 family)/DNA-binding XRE family transcriptional regulator [Sporolactobacillus spathodeae]
MFSCEKLTELRELNGLSRKELAAQLNVSEQAVWQYENESTIPRIEVLNKVRELFSVDTKFLFSKTFLNQTASEERVAYRSKDRESRKKTKLELTYISYIDYYISFFEKFLITPDSAIAVLRNKATEMLRSDPDQSMDQSITQTANLARKFLKLQNNKDLMYTLEMSGIYIAEKNLGPEIDAYSTITDDGRPFIILGNIKKSAVRRNFDLAHELGHILLHTAIDMETLTKQEHKQIEQQANQFASVFLLPEEDFKRDFAELPRHSNPDYYIEMKRKYMVSLVALAYRAYQLGLMTYQENRYFFGQLHKKGYQILEPLDDQMPPIRPGRVKSLLQLIFDKQICSISDLESKFHIHPLFLTNLFGLDKDFFDHYMQQKKEYFDSAQVIPIRINERE